MFLLCLYANEQVSTNRLWSKTHDTDTYMVQEKENHWVENPVLIALNCHFSRLESSDEKAATTEIIKL